MPTPPLLVIPIFWRLVILFAGLPIALPRLHSPDRTSLWPFSSIFHDLPSGEDVKPCSIILKLWQTAKFKRLWRSLRPAQFIHHNLPAPVWMINWKSVFSFVLGDLACHYRLFATRGKLWKFGFHALSKYFLKNLFFKIFYVTERELFNKWKILPSKIRGNQLVFLRENGLFFTFCSKNSLKNLFKFF